MTCVTHVTDVMIVTHVTLMLDTTNFLMPGLRRIAMVNTADLPKHIRMMNEADIVSTITAATTDVDFFGEAKLAYSRSKDGKQLASLSFMSSDYIPAKDVAFIVENQSRQRMIVGALEAPFPMVSIEDSSGSSPSDRRATAYTVTWAGRPAPVNVWMKDDDCLPVR